MTYQDTQILYPIDLVLTVGQALALERFLRRLGASDFKAHAVDEGDAKEAQEAVDAVKRALAEAGLGQR
jgi:hypothetical protein